MAPHVLGEENSRFATASVCQSPGNSATTLSAQTVTPDHFQAARDGNIGEYLREMPEPKGDSGPLDNLAVPELDHTISPSRDIRAVRNDHKR